MNPQDYIASFSFDQRLAPYDIRGSIAHVRMLEKTGIIPPEDSKKIQSGLKSIEKDILKGKPLPPAEDIHFAIEAELIRRIGDTGKKMHTARSRNDQVALDLKLYVRDMAQKAVAAVKAAQKAVVECAEKNEGVLMPGFTHLQHGQPIFFAHHILAYAWMLQRDRERFEDCLKRLDESPLGACALAGTSFPIDREFTAKALGFSRITENSIDSVSDRDFVIEFVFDCALTMVHLSRLAEELVIWSSSEFGYVALSEKFTSGSSIMPQKRNPDTAELLRGKASRAIGALVQLLTLVKGQPLAYNRDMQEDKPPLFESADTTLASLALTAGLVKGMTVNREKMEESCRKGFMAATDLADYLARKGVPFRKAHSIVAEIVRDLRKDSKKSENFTNLTIADLKSYHSKFEEDALDLLNPESNAKSRTSPGGTDVKSLNFQIKRFS